MGPGFETGGLGCLDGLQEEERKKFNQSADEPRWLAPYIGPKLIFIQYCVREPKLLCGQKGRPTTVVVLPHCCNSLGRSELKGIATL